MKISKTKFLVAGLLAGTLTFVGCKSDTSADRGTEPTEGTSTGTGTDTGTEGTGTSTDPGTGGSGPSKTKQSDDNLRMPEEDPLRTPEDESVRDAEQEPGVHDDATLDPGVGGSGTGGSGVEDVTEEDDLNEGGNPHEDFRIPDSPTDVVPDEGMNDDLDLPEGAR
jgi:hypothetical protein